jgi:hypothetical protein
MAGLNTDAIFSRAPDVQWISYLTTANTTADLTAGTSYLLFTADATNGGFVQKIRFRMTPAGTSTATVCRIWINNGSTTGTATNNILYDEITLPATAASGTAATPSYEIPLNFALPAGFKLYATIHTASTNGWAATVVGGKY